MPHIEIIEEKALTMAEMKEAIEKIEKRDKELGTRTKKTKDYLDHFLKGRNIKFKEYKEKLEKLGISRIKDKQIAKIIDLRPSDASALRSIFIGENITLKQEDINKLLEAIKEFK